MTAEKGLRLHPCSGFGDINKPNHVFILINHQGEKLLLIEPQDLEKYDSSIERSNSHHLCTDCAELNGGYVS